MLQIGVMQAFKMNSFSELSFREINTTAYLALNGPNTLSDPTRAFRADHHILAELQVASCLDLVTALE